MKSRFSTWKLVAISAIATTLGLASLAYFFIPSTASITNEPAATEATAQAAYGKLPLSFEANQGQTDSQVKFLSRGNGYTLFLTDAEAVLSLRVGDKETRRQGGKETNGIRKPQPQSPNQQSSVLRMKLVGANPSPQAGGLDELPGKSNYFIGNDPKQWRTDIPTYGKVKFAAVYPGVDVVYYGTQGRQLEYDFLLAPQSNPKAIRLSFEGADKIEVDKQGDLALRMNGKELRMRKPIVYQEKDGVRQEIAGRYTLSGEREVGFEIAAYDAARPMVIDPVLAYSTFLGGNGQDNGVGIAVSAHGDAFITGLTTSPNFPTEPNGSEFGPCSNGPCGAVDAFVSKLNAAGTSLVYSTYLGGSNDENLYSTYDTYSGIAVNSAGNAFVTGLTTSPDFPTTKPFVYQPDYGGGSADAYVVRLNLAGNALEYSTLLGGDGWEGGHSIAVDAADNAYVAGAVLPGNNPIKPTTPNDAPKGAYDGFVAILNSTGTNLNFFSYLGGSGWDLADGVAVDAQNNFYLVGWGNSKDLKVTPNAFQNNLKGGTDIFIWKFSAGGTLEYLSYLGGEVKNCSSNQDDAERTVNHGIAVESQGDLIYVTGQTDSTDFPTKNNPMSFNGCLTAFVTKLDIKLQPNDQLRYSRFLGGSGGGAGRAIGVDINGNAYVTGGSFGAFQSTSGLPTCSDTGAFVVKLGGAGAIEYAACLSGAGEDVGYDIAVDPAGCAYVTGYTQSDKFPVVNPIQQFFGGGIGDQPQDGFVTKICSGLDHFKCYDVRPQENFQPFNVILRDQFESQRVTVLRPATLCNPAIKCVPTGDPKNPFDCNQRLNPDDHLVCYETVDDRGTPQFEQREVFVSNQFGKEQRLTVWRRKNLLCVPSLKAHVDAKH
jgi:hypothetical protein